MLFLICIGIKYDHLKKELKSVKQRNEALLNIDKVTVIVSTIEDSLLKRDTVDFDLKKQHVHSIEFNPKHRVVRIDINRH